MSGERVKSKSFVPDRLTSDARFSFMLVFHKLEEVPADFGPTFVSVGNFDGVHRAHAHVLGEIVSRARAAKAKVKSDSAKTRKPAPKSHRAKPKAP